MLAVFLATPCLRPHCPALACQNFFTARIRRFSSVLT